MRNAAPWLQETLSSIQAQTFDQWECILVDDASDDHSASIVQTFAQSDPRFQLWTNTGKGIIPALRLAYSKSSGTYITRMDADDRMHPQKLERLLFALEQKGKGWLVTAQVEYFKADGHVADGFSRYAQWLNNLTETHSHWNALYTECVIPSPCWLIHRDDLDRAGGFTSDQYPADYDLGFRWYAAGLKGFGHKEVLTCWSDHDTRASRTDPNYTDQAFIPLKMYYFPKLHQDPSKALVLWGAGPKGKQLARLFLEMGWNFQWVTSNPNKIGHQIYGKMLMDPTMMKDGPAQWIIAISQRGIKTEIYTQFQTQGLQEGRDFFFWF